MESQQSKEPFQSDKEKYKTIQECVAANMKAAGHDYPKTKSKEPLGITPGEWKYFMDADKFTIISEDNDYLFSSYSIRGDDGSHIENANAEAICTAINSTYKKGLNPEGMEELYKACQWLLNAENSDTIASAKEAVAKALANSKL